MAGTTTITDAVGDKFKGKPAPNRANDVKVIQALLQQAFGRSAPRMADGTCDAATKAAIMEFQKIWTSHPDGTVDPAGDTLKRLIRVTTPLSLKPITLKTAEHGGYVISYKTVDQGPLPSVGKGYTVHLAFQNDQNLVDVTGSKRDDLLNGDNIGDVLKIFEKLGFWGVPIGCKLYLKFKGDVISESNSVSFVSPVQPHNGNLLPLDETSNGAKLIYQGSAGDYHGRMFAKVSGYDKFLFVYGGRFETDASFRGFDCITYAGTTCGASRSHQAQQADMADDVDAKEVEFSQKIKDPKSGSDVSKSTKLEAADPAVVKEFFKTNPQGYFLMWQSGHIVIVTDGTVYEFKESSPSGYNATPVAEWLEPYKTMKLTVRKLPNKPARAS